MDNVLIVSNTNSTMGIISDLLQSESFSRIVTTQNGSEARRYISELDFDLIIIDTPLPDEHGDDLSLTAADKTTAGIILIVQADNLSEVNSRVEDSGVFTLPKPISPEFFYQSVKLLEASRRRVMHLEDENQKLQKKIEEIRIVDRAKLILVQVLNMTEPQAHRYIEKQAMDMRQPRTTVAENILKTYER
jgi:response regulator NasT